MNVTCISLVPSPYQRDLFKALAALEDINLKVFYNEESSPDSPWPKSQLEPYESILNGSVFGPITARFHWNSFPREILCADVIILNGYMNNVSQKLLRMKPGERPPIVFWAERMHSEAKGIKKVLKNFLAKPIHNAQGITAIGSLAEKSYAELYPKVRRQNIPYLCEVDPFLKIQRNQIPKRPTLLFCGQMIERKGIDLLLSAFEDVLNSGLEADLHLIGREAELDIHMQGLNLNTKKHIHYLGFQAPEDLPKFFAKADIFILPSRYDGWGVVVNQALAAGMSLICTDAVGAAHDLIQQGKNGMLCRANNKSSLVEAITKMLSDHDFIKKAQRCSREMANEYTPSAGAQQWYQFLRSLQK